MRDLAITSNEEVDQVFKRYPESVREKLLYLRRLVVETAISIPEVTALEETLKWGEPSYLTKHGSTIRMDWKEKKPRQYAMYFKCTSKLVPTFRTLYGELFEFEGNRAIIFQLDEEVPEAELKNCIRAGLTYHKVKQLPLLGLG